MKIISKKEAKEQDLPFYFTGKECKRGHIAERIIGSGNCRICNAEKSREWRKQNPDANNEWRAANPEKVKAKSDRGYQKNKVKINARNNQYHIDNAEKISIQRAGYYQENKEKLKADQREYGKANRHITRAQNMKHHCDKLQRTPEWANLEYIKDIYRNCPEGQVVDHIIPLRGKDVSGLHVEYNLQYLTAEENLKKRNKFPYEDYTIWQ